MDGWLALICADGTEAVDRGYARQAARVVEAGDRWGVAPPSPVFGRFERGGFLVTEMALFDRPTGGTELIPRLRLEAFVLAPDAVAVPAG